MIDTVNDIASTNANEHWESKSLALKVDISSASREKKINQTEILIKAIVGLFSCFVLNIDYQKVRSFHCANDD